LDLTNREAIFNFVSKVVPDLVIDAAAKVGGIGANSAKPVDFLTINLQIQVNLMDACHNANVERLIFLGSSCIYPRDAKQPINENSLMSGPLESTNSAYAIAKIAGIEMIKSYRNQHGRKWISLMPTNMYGPRDNFHLQEGHVLPSLINRFVSATKEGAPHIELWGTGSPLREFLFSEDLARAVVVAESSYDDDLHVNVGSDEEISIRELATLLAEASGYKGEVVWNKDKPDGVPRKVLDSTRMRSMGWTPLVHLEEGISKTVKWFNENYFEARK
jgi:GDP-L-fucose synthase